MISCHIFRIFKDISAKKEIKPKVIIFVIEMLILLLLIFLFLSLPLNIVFIFVDIYPWILRSQPPGTLRPPDIWDLRESQQYHHHHHHHHGWNQLEEQGYLIWKVIRKIWGACAVIFIVALSIILLTFFGVPTNFIVFCNNVLQSHYSSKPLS